MKKAALVLATSVAFFFGAMNAEAGRKMVSMPSAKSVATGGGSAVKDTGRVRIPGEPGTEYIPRTPSGTTGTPIKVLPTIDYSIPRTITQAKNILKGNLGQVLLQGSIAAAVAGVGWVMTDGVLVKKKETVQPVDNGYLWSGNKASASESCQKVLDDFVAAHPSVTPVSQSIGAVLDWGSGKRTICTYVFADSTGAQTSADYQITATKQGNGCVAPSYFSTVLGGCVLTSNVPVQDSDYSLLDPYINAQGGEWLKDLLRWSCSGTYGGPNPDACYQSLVEQTHVTGPASAAGPSTSSLVRGPNGITTVETTTTYNIRYGDNYFDWTTSVNTHKVNPDGTTEDTTETEEEQEEEPEAPALGDPYAPVIQKYKDIATEVSNPPQVPANVNYSPWYSFGGTCSELNLVLPIYGPYTTNICPYIYDWVRPVLAFLLALYTWHRCREMWSEALRIARPI